MTMKLYESYIAKTKSWQELEHLIQSGSTDQKAFEALREELEEIEVAHEQKALSIMRLIKGCIAESKAM